MKSIKKKGDKVKKEKEKLVELSEFYKSNGRKKNDIPLYAYVIDGYVDVDILKRRTKFVTVENMSLHIPIRNQRGRIIDRLHVKKNEWKGRVFWCFDKVIYPERKNAIVYGKAGRKARGELDL